jgi:hypothetical protein
MGTIELSLLLEFLRQIGPRLPAIFEAMKSGDIPVDQILPKMRAELEAEVRLAKAKEEPT